MFENVRGRVARPASTAWNVTKTLVQTACFCGVFLVAIPCGFHALEQSLGIASQCFSGNFWRAFGIVLIIAGSALGLICAIVMATKGKGTPMPTDSTRELVVAGPYRYIRNPMVISGSTQAIGISILLGSPFLVVGVILSMLLWNVTLRRWEEVDLEHGFGKSYTAYRLRVRCWRASFQPYRPERDPYHPPVSTDRTLPPGGNVIVYDGRCVFCDAASIRLLGMMRRAPAVRVDFWQEGALAQLPGVSSDACKARLHLITPDGRVYGGFEAAIRAFMAARPTLGLLGYAYYLPCVRLACDVFYDIVGRNRYRLMGIKDPTVVCDDNSCKPNT